MAALDTEKSFKWSVGKIIGILSIIFLIIGLVLPYHRNLSLIEIRYLGLFKYIPILSAILIAILLSEKYFIYIKRDSNYIKINHFILMIWGLWFFLTHLINHSEFYTLGLGLAVITAGYFLFILSGFLEWRRQARIGQTTIPIKKTIEKPSVKQGELVSIPQKISGSSASIIQDKPSYRSTFEAIAHKERQIKKPPSSTVTPTVKSKPIEKVVREPTSEEEKTLMRWVRHIDEYNKTYEQCMKCKNYVFLRASDSGNIIVFTCPKCGESFTLNK